MRNVTSRLTFASALAASLGAYASAFPPPRIPKPRKRVPTMVTASPEEIAAWYAAIEARKPLTLSKRQIERAANKVFKGTGQNPKFPKARAHKQHKHPLRDARGSYTLVGSTYTVEGLKPDENREHVISAGQDNGEPFYTARRKWLAGISQQRGY